MAIVPKTTATFTCDLGIQGILSVLKFKFLVNLKIFRKLTFSVIWIYFGQLSLSLWRCKQKFNIIKTFNLKNMTIVLVFTHVFKVKMYSFINYLIDKNKIL